MEPHHPPSIRVQNGNNIEKANSKELNTIMLMVNKENNSAEVNGGNPAMEKDSPAHDSSGSEQQLVGSFSPKPNSGLSSLNGQPAPRLATASSSSPSSTISSPTSSVCSPVFGTPAMVPSSSSSLNTASDNSEIKVLNGLNRNSAFNVAAAAVQNKTLLLSQQHLLDLNQMRPQGHLPSSPPYKFFPESAFYQSRQLLNGNDLSEFKLNVQMKQSREAFATASEATSEEVVVDGNDDGTEDSHHNAVSSRNFRTFLQLEI